MEYNYGNVSILAMIGRGVEATLVQKFRGSVSFAQHLEIDSLL